MKQQIELLAPAGSFDSLRAAINAGADAIYFGVEQLNMRTKSSDPIRIDDIESIAQICHQQKVKAYITLNTVMYDHDLQLLRHILNEVKKHSIDAVIAADLSVIQQCREMEISVHISTQANVSNISAVQFFAPYSDVIVLARELTLKQTAHIAAEIKRKNICGPGGEHVKLELFVHGALCMAISGKCYMSLHTQNASANRGACTQNCRRPYRVYDTETDTELIVDNEYIMSPKDLCTIDFLDELIGAGVSVLKIEGRSKGAEYVYTTTKCYREAIDAVKEGCFSKEKIAVWMEELKKVYNRDFWDGYYLGRKLGEWTPTPGSIATEKKMYVGKGSNYYAKKRIAEFLVETGIIKKGDTLMVTGPECGVVKETIETLYVNGEEKDMAAKGDKVTFPFATKTTAKDKLYKLV